jgi:hypothetical protein
MPRVLAYPPTSLRLWNPQPPPKLSPQGIRGGCHVTHWRSHVGRADVIQGAGDHDVEYFGGWVISVALTLATVLVVWHFRI